MIEMIELFAGIGAFRKALTNLGISHTSIISEIDKHAIKAYNAIHGETPNLGNICDIEKLPKCDILTYGFPCQDISSAGLTKGLSEGSGTRSGLLWEIKRLLISSELPPVLIMENVKALTFKKNMPDFQKWILFLKSLCYTSSWQNINAKDHRCPQNRERIFMVSMLGGQTYKFPAKSESTLCLMYILEEKVDESYFLTAKQIKSYEAHKERHEVKGHHNLGWKPSDGRGYAHSLTCKADRNKSDLIIVAGDLNNARESAGRIYNTCGISPTLSACGGGDTQIKVLLPVGTLNRPGTWKQRDEVFDPNNIGPTLLCSAEKGNIANILIDDIPLRIRKLTEREYYRLMCFTDDDFDRARAVISNTQLYKTAGNSIVVNVLEDIFIELFMQNKELNKMAWSS